MMLIQYLCIFFPRHSHHSIHSQESTLLGPLSNIISIRNGRTAVVAGRYVDAISESITLIDIQGTFVHVHIAVLAGPCTVAQTIATREQALAVDAFRTQACKGEVMSNLYNYNLWAIELACLREADWNYDLVVLGGSRCLKKVAICNIKRLKPVPLCHRSAF